MQRPVIRASRCLAFTAESENRRSIMPTTKQSVEQVHASLGGDSSRSWGSFSCLGTAYGEFVANFSPSGSSQVTTVVVPANLEQLALVALQQKLTVLASFNGPLQAYATITDLAIYN
jgi:hypothetical protein